jgi:hypothetical protein
MLSMLPWPSIDALRMQVPLPVGLSMRLWRANELAGVPQLLRSWYPTANVGAESVFLDEAFLHQRVTHEGGPEVEIFAFCVEADDQPIAFMSFQREAAAQTLHARLGVLAPSHRQGFVGALGFMAFEAIGRLCRAELLLAWVTLASVAQQRFAERRGFRLTGIVPGFDRDATSKGTARVTEALYAKLLVPFESIHLPDDDSLTPNSRAMLKLVLEQKPYPTKG